MPRQRYDNLGSVGLNTDLQPSALPPAAWTVLDNVACENGVLRSVYGEDKSWDLPCRPLYHTTFRKLTGEWYAVVSNGLRVYLVNLADGVATDITPTDGFDLIKSDKWTLGTGWEELPDEVFTHIPVQNLLDGDQWTLGTGMVEDPDETFALDPGNNKLTSAGWTLGAGWTESPDDVFAHADETEPLSHSFEVIPDRYYEVAWTVTNRTVGSFRVSVGGAMSPAKTATGSWLAKAETIAGLIIIPTAEFDGTLSLISLKLQKNMLFTGDWAISDGWKEDPDDVFAHTTGIHPLIHDAPIEIGRTYEGSWTVTDQTGAIPGGFSVSIGGMVTPILHKNFLFTQWWAVGAGWVETPDETFTHTHGSIADLSNYSVVVKGKLYEVFWVMAGRTAGSVVVTVGGVESDPQVVSGKLRVSAETTRGLVITPTSDFDGVLSGLSLRLAAETIAFVAESTAGLVITPETDFNGKISLARLIQVQENPVKIEAGKYYDLSWTVAGRTAGSFRLTLGGAAPSTRTATGKVRILALDDTGLYIDPSDDFDGKISGVEVKPFEDLLTSPEWIVGAGWRESPDDVFKHSSGVVPLSHPVETVAEKLYEIAWAVTERTAGTFTVSVGGAATTAQTGSGTFFTKAVNALGVVITPTTDFDGKLSGLSLREPLWQDLTFTVGQVYTITWTVKDRTAGSFVLTLGGVNSSAYTASGSWTVTATSTDGLSVMPTTDFDGEVSEIVIKPQITGFNADNVTMTNLNGVLVVNSDKDGPFYLKDNKLLSLPRWDPSWRCLAMAAYRYFLIALNMTEEGNKYPHKLRWSGSAEEGAIPAVWVPAVENDAGDDLLGETLGHIVGGVIVRDQLAIVKEDAAYSLAYVGGQFVMRTDRLHGSVGTQVRRGYADMGGGLVTATARDLMVYDGHTASSIAVGTVREALKALALEANWEKVVVFAHKASTTLWVAGSTEPASRLTSVLVFDWTRRAWWTKELLNGYGFDSLRLADQGEPLTEILLYESNDTDSQWWLATLATQDTNSDDTPKTCLAERTGLPIEGADGLALAREAWLDLDGTANLSVAFGGQVTPDGPVTWAAPQTWTPGVSHNLTPRVTGRFLAVSIQSVSSGWWKLGAITVDWTRAGER